MRRPRVATWDREDPILSFWAARAAYFARLTELGAKGYLSKMATVDQIQDAFVVTKGFGDGLEVVVSGEGVDEHVLDLAVDFVTGEGHVPSLSKAVQRGAAPVSAG